MKNLVKLTIAAVLATSALTAVSLASAMPVPASMKYSAAAKNKAKLDKVIAKTNKMGTIKAAKASASGSKTTKNLPASMRLQQINSEVVAGKATKYASSTKYKALSAPVEDVVSENAMADDEVNNIINTKVGQISDDQSDLMDMEADNSVASGKRNYNIKPIKESSIISKRR